MHSQTRGAGGQSRLSRINIFVLTGMSITETHRNADMTTRGLKIIPLDLALMVIGVQQQQVYAANEGSAYRAGYAHGVSDAKVSVNATLYITQPGKDFGSHTKQFNQGYIDGYCSIAGSGAGMDSDQHATFECYYDASQGATNSSSDSQH